MALGYSWTNIASDSVNISGTEVEFYVDAKLNKQDIANNKSVIDLRLNYWFQYWLSSYDTDFYLTGAGWLGYAYRSWETGASGTMMTAQITVTHNADGTGSFTAEGGYEFKGLGVGATTFKSGSVQLPTIPRASVPTASPNPITLSNATQALTVNTNRKASAFTHTVRCVIGSFNQTKTGVGTSTSFDLPYSLIASIAYGKKSLTGTIYCTTYNGSTQIGSQQSTTFTAQIDTNKEHPTIGTVALEDTNEKSEAIEASGSFIKWASNLKATIQIGVTGSYTELFYATVVCGTNSQTFPLTGTTGSIVFETEKIDADFLTVYATDRRGVTVSKKVSWTLIPYLDLTVTGDVQRVSETGNEVKFTLTGGCFAGSFGQAVNEVTVSYRYKLTTTSTWTEGSQTFTFTPSGSGETTFNYSNTLTGFDYDKRYDFEFTVTDLFTEATTRIITIPTGIPVYGNGEDFFAVYGKLYLHHDRDNPEDFMELYKVINALLEINKLTNLVTLSLQSAQTNNGVTYTPLANGTISVKGTATAYSSMDVGTFTGESGVTYVLSGCPEGGGIRTYSLGVDGTSYKDTGSGVEFTATGAKTLYIDVFMGETVDLIFAPKVLDKRVA